MKSFIKELLVLSLIVSSPAVVRADQMVEDGQKFLSGVQIRLSTWLSEGQDIEDTYVDDDLFAASPISILEYKNLDADILEFGVKFHLPKQFYLDLAYGEGDIDDGQLIDEDYFSGLVRDILEGSASNAQDFLVSQTLSSIRKDKSEIFSIELGKQLYTAATKKWSLSGFVKYQEIEETYIATGLVQQVCAFPYEFCNPAGSNFNAQLGDRSLLSNKVSWDSWLVGISGVIDLTKKWSLRGKFAYVLDSDASAVDIHYLRDDLQHNPSFLANASADGYDLDMELSYSINPNWVVALGYRMIQRDYGRDDNGGRVFPVENDGTSNSYGVKGDFERDGLILSVKYNFTGKKH